MTPEWNVVHDPTDRMEDAVRIFEMGQLDRIEVIFPGTNDSEMGLALGILAALGKSVDSLPRQRSKAIDAARMWLYAESVDALIVVDRSRIGLESILSASSIRVWLVAQSEEWRKKWRRAARGFET